MEDTKSKISKRFTISIIRKLLKVIKIKLLDSKFMKKYTNVYQNAYNNICNVTTKDLKMTRKIANMLL